MKYINQFDYSHWLYVTRTELLDEEVREKGKTTTVRNAGCGLCAAIMVADRLLPNSEFSMQDAIELSYSVKANDRKGTSYKRFAPAFAEKMGFRLEMTNEPEKLRNCLRTGGAAVVHIGGDYEGHVGVFSHGGHFVAAINVEPDGRIAILDPSYKDGKYEEEGRKGRVELKNGVIALCDASLLVEDTATRNPGFYLFWRE